MSSTLERATLPTVASRRGGLSNLTFCIEVRDDRGVRRHPLVEEVVLIGRGAECDVIVDARGVSRQHAALRRVAEGYQIDDSSSRNGVSVNGTPLEGPRLLRAGDEISIGEARVVVSATEVAPPPLTEAVTPTRSDGAPLLAVARRLLEADLDIDRLLALVLDVLMVETRAKRGFVVLVEDGAITPRVARSVEGRDLEGPAVQLSRTLVDEAIRTGRAVLIRDAAEEKRFEAASIHHYGLRSVLVVPIPGRSSPALGAVYLDDPTRRATFGPAESALSHEIAALVAGPLENARVHGRQREELTRLRDELQGRHTFGAVVTASPRLRAAIDLLRRAAGTDVSVLLHGETGTGKELLARALHAASSRRSGPFVAIDAAGLSEHLLESELFGHVQGAFTGAVEARNGLLREAGGGTLFLDNLEETSPAVQARLLRALQEREIRPVGSDQVLPIDVRVVAAAGEDPLELVRGGLLREDLYYRLAGLVVEVPPLRDRREDIPWLVERALVRAGGGTIEPAALALLVDHAWPGNARELENVVQELQIKAGKGGISAELVARRLAMEGPDRQGEQTVSLAEARERFERRVVAAALARACGNVAAAARELQVDRSQMHRVLKRLGLNPGVYRR